jgi:hypothetical protein
LRVSWVRVWLGVHAENPPCKGRRGSGWTRAPLALDQSVRPPSLEGIRGMYSDIHTDMNTHSCWTYMHRASRTPWNQHRGPSWADTHMLLVFILFAGDASWSALPGEFYFLPFFTLPLYNLFSFTFTSIFCLLSLDFRCYLGSGCTVVIRTGVS